MPSVKLNKKVVLKLLGGKVSDEQLKDRISYLGTDLEHIDKEEIAVEIFPNRPDLLSEQGFARALSSFMGKNTGLKKYSVKKSGHKVIIESSVKSVRPFTACAIVKGIKFTEERITEVVNMQEKLHVTYCRNRKKAAIGVYPMEHITPPIRFLAKKPRDISFAPLELNKELTASQILSMHPTGRTYGHLLEGCNTYPVFIDAKNNVMSLPPIINSNKVGKITSKTKNVFVECSGFDYEYLRVCLNMIVTALADMGGQIFSVEIKDGRKTITSPDLSPKEINLDVTFINEWLGLSLSEQQMKQCLERMGYDYKNKKAFIPSYRADIMHQVDLAEDVAIAYGYEKFTPELSPASTVAAEHPLTTFENKIRVALAGHGLLEVCNVHLSNERTQCQKIRVRKKLVQLRNALNEDYSSLRHSLMPGLLETLERNKPYDYPQNLFELGTVFAHDEKEENGIKETDLLSISLCNKNADFTKIKQIVDSLLRTLAIEYTITESKDPTYIEGRVGNIIVNDVAIGVVGEISPEVLDVFSLEMPVAACELNLEKLFSSIK